MKLISIIFKIKINIKYDILDMYINFGKYEKKKCLLLVICVKMRLGG